MSVSTILNQEGKLSTNVIPKNTYNYEFTAYADDILQLALAYPQSIKPFNDFDSPDDPELNYQQTTYYDFNKGGNIPSNFISSALTSTKLKMNLSGGVHVSCSDLTKSSIPNIGTMQGFYHSIAFSPKIIFYFQPIDTTQPQEQVKYWFEKRANVQAIYPMDDFNNYLNFKCSQEFEINTDQNEYSIDPKYFDPTQYISCNVVINLYAGGFDSDNTGQISLNYAKNNQALKANGQTQFLVTPCSVQENMIFVNLQLI